MRLALPSFVVPATFATRGGPREARGPSRAARDCPWAREDEGILVFEAARWAADPSLVDALKKVQVEEEVDESWSEGARESFAGALAACAPKR